MLRSNVSTNSRKICEFDSIRIGVQEVTRRGMKEKEMETIAGFFNKIIIEGKNIKNDVVAFNNMFAKVEYSFDNLLIPNGE